jgi:hypothetical protein
VGGSLGFHMVGTGWRRLPLGQPWGQWQRMKTMDEGTLKTPIPTCRLYWSFLFGVVKQFCTFWIWSETECKTPAEWKSVNRS